MLRMWTPYKLLERRVDSCLAEGMPQSMNTEACLNVNKWKTKWSEKMPVKESTSLEGDLGLISCLLIDLIYAIKQVSFLLGASVSLSVKWR